MSNVNAASGSAADIQDAVNTVAGSGGGIVFIPDGDFDFNGNVTVPSGVSLEGEGIGITTLNTHSTTEFITITGYDIRLTGFTIINPNDTGGYGLKATNAMNFRIDNCRVEGYGPGYKAAIRVYGVNSYGVIDHNHIETPINTTSYGVDIWKAGTSSPWPNEGINDRDNYVPDRSLFVCMEDNTFVNNRHSVSANGGATYIFRYNTITGGNGNTSSRIDAHGPTQYGNGTRYFEAYNNTIGSPAPYGGSFAINPRGGDGVIYNNTVTGYTDAVIVTLEEGQNNSYPQTHQCHRVYVWGNTGQSGVEVKTGTWVPSSNAIQGGRDWYNSAKPGYTAYTYPHPLVGGEGGTPPGIVKRFTGAVWETLYIYVYLDGSWQTAPLKWWDGAAWQLSA